MDIFRFLTWIVNSPTTCTCTCYAGGVVELVGVLVGGHASVMFTQGKREVSAGASGKAGSWRLTCVRIDFFVNLNGSKTEMNEPDTMMRDA